MKENAIGLANITLLATMSFVTIATTSSLYFSSQKQANEMFPKNTKITFADYGYTDPNAKVVSEGELKEKFQEQVTDKLNKPDDEYIIYQTVSSMSHQTKSQQLINQLILLQKMTLFREMLRREKDTWIPYIPLQVVSSSLDSCLGLVSCLVQP